jgi:hypothetical protein
MIGLRFHAPPRPRPDDPRLAAALRQFDEVRRFREIAAASRRLDRWMSDLLGRLLGLITYDLPRAPSFLTFSCAGGAPLPRLVAGVDERGVCIALVDGPGFSGDRP